MRRVATTAAAVVVALVVGVAAGAASSRFSDVPTDHVHYEAIEWATANGLVAGKGDGRFDPSGKLTRAHLVAILYRYHQKYGAVPDHSHSVPDHSHSYVPEHSHSQGGASGGVAHDCQLTTPAWTFGPSYLQTGVSERWGFDDHVHSIRVRGSVMSDGLTNVLAVECEHR